MGSELVKRNLFLFWLFLPEENENLVRKFQQHVKYWKCHWMTNYTERARLSAAFEAFYTAQANRHRSTAFNISKCLLYKNVYKKEHLSLSWLSKYSGLSKSPRLVIKHCLIGQTFTVLLWRHLVTHFMSFFWIYKLHEFKFVNTATNILHRDI